MIRRLAVLIAFAFAAHLPIAAPAAAAGPEWRLSVASNADYFLPGGFGVYRLDAVNVGNAPTSSADPIEILNNPPPGTTVEGMHFYNYALSETDLGSLGACPSNDICLYPEASSGSLKSALASHPILPGGRLEMFVLIRVPAGSPEALEDVARVSGGGAAEPAEASATATVSPLPPFGRLDFASELADSSAAPYTQAGGHPFKLTTEFNFATYSNVGENDLKNGEWQMSGRRPIRDPKEIAADLPPGLVANPQAVPQCAQAAFYTEACGPATIIGSICLRTGGTYAKASCVRIEPIYNLVPEGNYPGQLGADFLTAPFILINSAVRSGSDYGISALNVAPPVGLNRVKVSLWGIPADHSHDRMRRIVVEGGGGFGCGFDSEEFSHETVAEIEMRCESDPQVPPLAAETPAVPFITLPTECAGAELSVLGRYNSWSDPSLFAHSAVTLPPVNGCSQLSFEPTIEARPTTTLADAPSGLDFTLDVPQNQAGPEGKEDPEGRASSELKEAVVKLPAGLAVNPSSANGLGACSPAQIGLTTAVGQTPAHFTESPAQCPAASAIGSAEVNTALLHNPFRGTVYLATPHQNPFGSFLAGYIVLEGSGLVFKLPGRIETDPATGQLTGRFTENPQLPFEQFHLRFFGGAQGDLRTPPTCGTYATTAQLTPYSHLEGEEEATPIAEPTAEFETTVASSGSGKCPRRSSELANAPVFRAGTESPQAGAYSPFSLKLVRQDGSQEIKGIETTLPEGLVGRLAGTSYCPDSALAAAAQKSGVVEQASPSCPASSEVGTVDVAAGAGPTPLNVPGKAYLAGSYKGAPLSLAIITPAVAGPFDLGTVVVRTALYVDPLTTQITAKSDPIPTILEGIPLDVRSITLKMARPNFTLNPTNCEPLAITGSALSVLNAAAPLSQRFQVGGCRALPFKPKLALRLKGSPRRAQFPSLTATLTMPSGDANIASAQVTLPHSSFLSQGHIDKTCGRPQLASHSCPAASIYGHARAITPLLDHPLEGPVYLATGFGYQLPALVADLNGQIEVLLKGKVDSGRADGIRNTFEVVPDAPVSKFTLHMFGGKKSLIENSQYLCAKHAKRKALARFTGQNGKIAELEPTVKNSCKRKKGKKGKGGHGHHKRHGG